MHVRIILYWYFVLVIPGTATRVRALASCTAAVGHFAPWQDTGTGIGTPALPADGVLVVDGKPIVARSPSVREEAADSATIIALMNRLTDAGLPRPVIGRRYPLREVAAALDASVNNHVAGKTCGKIAIEVPPVERGTM